jgi:hypothetical protein
MGGGFRKDPGFSGLLLNKEYAAAGNDFAQRDLHDQQLTARSAQKLAVAQASKLLGCLGLYLGL